MDLYWTCIGLILDLLRLILEGDPSLVRPEIRIQINKKPGIAI